MSFTIIRRNGDTYVFDATVAFDAGRDAQATEHPVERDGPIVDNVQPMARAWTVRAIVSEGSGNDYTPQEFVFVLDDIARRGELVTILYPRLGSYSGVVLEGYAYPVGIFRRILFTMRWREVRQAFASTVRIPPSAPPPGAGDLSEGEDAGKLGTDEADADADARGKSILIGGYDLIFGGAR